jgi:hypothetical protein
MASTISAGTTTTTSLSFSGDTSGVLQLQTNGTTTAVTIDTAQRIGIQSTPSSWASPFVPIEYNSGTYQASIAFQSNGNVLSLFTNQYYNGSNNVYKYNGYALQYYLSNNGQHQWFVAPSGTAGATISATQAMTLDNSGNLGIGTTTPGYPLQVYTSSSSNPATISMVNNGTSNTSSLAFVQNGSNNASYTYIVGDGRSSGYLSFSTNNAERARIDNSGNLLVGTASTIGASAAGTTHINGGANNGNEAPLYLRNQYSTAGHYWKVGPTNNAGFIIYNDSNTGQYQTYGATSWTSSSDERLKTNLIPIQNALQKVSTLRAVTGRYLTDEETVSRSFLIAQDVQAVLPEAIDVQNDEKQTLGLRYTEVIPLLVAAIKELSAQVTTLQSQVAALTPKA